MNDEEKKIPGIIAYMAMGSLVAIAAGLLLQDVIAVYGLFFFALSALLSVPFNKKGVNKTGEILFILIASLFLGYVLFIK